MSVVSPPCEFMVINAAEVPVYFGGAGLKFRPYQSTIIVRRFGLH